MTQEEKQLLLKDLSARLFYGVKGLAYIVGEPCRTNTNIVGIINESIVTDYESPMLDLIDLNSKDIIIKPYLRPMSSMTDEEMAVLREFGVCDDYAFHNDIYDIGVSIEDVFGVISWLLKRHFDFNYLIEKGLALEAPEGMYE